MMIISILLVVVIGLVWGGIALWQGINSHCESRYQYEPNNWLWVALFFIAQFVLIAGLGMASTPLLYGLAGIGSWVGAVSFAVYRIRQKTSWVIAGASVTLQLVTAVCAVFALILAAVAAAAFVCWFFFYDSRRYVVVR